MLSPHARRGACRLTLHPLAAAFALALALDSGVANAAASMPDAPQTLTVTNCGDSGSGSLRQLAESADDGDTIDLTQLSCSVISLSSGAIVIGASDVTLQGPGSGRLMLEGSGGSGDGILYDLGGGKLTVEGIDLAFGAKYGVNQAAHGGCVYAANDLAISDANVYACGVHAGTYAASGGALYARGSLTMTQVDISLCGLTTSGAAKGGGVFAGTDLVMAYSTVSGCRNATTGVGYGGGVYSGGDLTVKYSTISDNENDEGIVGLGGGTFSRGVATIIWSTISGNSAITGGGAYMGHNAYSPTALINDSTISGNIAQAGGGICARLPIEVQNSTIAFNTIPRSYTIPLGYAFSAGLSLQGASASIDSSIISNNVAIGQTNRLEDVGGDITLTIGGSDDLIMSAAQPLPAGTITADPLLAPLTNNGGLTQTHALLPGSPAIDQGAAGIFDTDQRGTGFPRVLNGRADIGAYEVNPDLIFGNGFD